MTTRIEKLQTQITKLNETLEALRGTFNEKAEALAAAQAELSSLQRIAAVQQGDVVTFAVGRKDDRRELTGNVLGVQDDEAKGKLLRVFAGEGFEAQVYTVAAKDIVGVKGEEHAADVADEAEATCAE